MSSLITHMKKYDSKKILITGATGFVGQALIARLLTNTSARIVALGRTLSKNRFHDEKLRLIQCDLSDVQSLSQLEDENFDVIFHLAAWLAGQGTVQDAFKMNIECSKRIAHFAADKKARLIHMSSVAVYGLPQYSLLNSESPLEIEKNDLYGSSKALGEIAVQNIMKTRQAWFCIFRPGLIFGPRADSWLMRPLRMIQNNQPLIIGQGTGHAFPIYIENLIDQILIAPLVDAANTHAFIAVDEILHWADFFSYFEIFLGKKVKRVPSFLAALVAQYYQLFQKHPLLTPHRLAIAQRQLNFDTSRTREVLKYRPLIHLDDGFRNSFRWVQKENLL
jgi:nucleoside-diphosphate-sugar epimerase